MGIKGQMGTDNDSDWACKIDYSKPLDMVLIIILIHN